ncbi:hypothetical protein Q2941_25965 [Bradyrhizobium sp. UFLA05-153]
MNDSDARGLVLKRFYDLRETRDHLELADFADLELASRDLGRALEQLADKGLIDWKPRKSSMTSAIEYVVIHARITGDGTDVIEGRAIPPTAITLDASINIHGSQGVQVGGQGNTQNVNLDLEQLNNYIDSSNASTVAKKKAKSLLKQVWENPLVKGAFEWGLKHFGGG